MRFRYEALSQGVDWLLSNAGHADQDSTLNVNSDYKPPEEMQGSLIEDYGESSPVRVNVTPTPEGKDADPVTLSLAEDELARQ